jgi:hypothetical protein
MTGKKTAMSGKSWLPPHDNELLKLREEGYTQAVIAERLDRTLTAVKGRLYQLLGRDRHEYLGVVARKKREPLLPGMAWNLAPDAFKDIKLTPDPKFASNKPIHRESDYEV